MNIAFSQVSYSSWLVWYVQNDVALSSNQPSHMSVYFDQGRTAQR